MFASFRWLGAFVFLVNSASASATPVLEVVVDEERPTCPLEFQTSDGHELVGGSIRCGNTVGTFSFSDARTRGGAPLYRERRGLVRCTVITLSVASIDRDHVSGTLNYK